MNKSLLPYLLILSLLSCEDEVKFDGERYLPFQVGNYWRLVPESEISSAIEITVTDEVVIHGKNYFKLHWIIDQPYNDPFLELNIYYRIDEKDFLYYLSDSAANIDVHTLKLGAPSEYRWTMESGTTVVVRKHAEIINDYTFSDCKTFFHNAGGTDGEYHITLASDIGYCIIYRGWGDLSYLAEARINGVEYHFDE